MTKPKGRADVHLRARTTTDAATPDLRLARWLRDLRAIDLVWHEGMTFEGQDVHVDGRGFRDCTFVRCRLVISLGVYIFTGTSTFTDCTWHAGHVTKATLETLRAVNRSDLDQGPVH